MENIDMSKDFNGIISNLAYAFDMRAEEARRRAAGLEEIQARPDAAAWGAGAGASGQHHRLDIDAARAEARKFARRAAVAQEGYLLMSPDEYGDVDFLSDYAQAIADATAAGRVLNGDRQG